MALNEFVAWCRQEPRPGFTKATVSAWRVSLETRGLGSSSIIIRMSAVRKLATEAADNGLLAPELRRCWPTEPTQPTTPLLAVGRSEPRHSEGRAGTRISLSLRPRVPPVSPPVLFGSAKKFFPKGDVASKSFAEPPGRASRHSVEK
jgi:hypothetical protein